MPCHLGGTNLTANQEDEEERKRHVDCYSLVAFQRHPDGVLGEGVVVRRPSAEARHIVGAHNGRVAGEERLSHVGLVRMQLHHGHLAMLRLIGAHPQVLHPDVRVGARR